MKNSLSPFLRCQVADFTLGKTSSKALCAASRDAYRFDSPCLGTPKRKSHGTIWRKSMAKTHRFDDFMAKIIENPWDLCMIGHLDLDIDIELENLGVSNGRNKGRISWNGGISWGNRG